MTEHDKPHTEEDKAKLPLLEPGQEIVGENESCWYIREGNRSWPVSKPPALNLNLCNAAEVLTPEERLALENDLGSLAAARAHRPPTYYTDRIV